MEKEIVIIKEEEYQKIKQLLNKKDDYFSTEELQIFTKKNGVILVQFI